MIRLRNTVRLAFITTAIYGLGASAWIWMTNPTLAISLALIGIALLTSVTGFLWESRVVARATSLVSIAATLIGWGPIKGMLGI